MTKATNIAMMRRMPKKGKNAVKSPRMIVANSSAMTERMATPIRKRDEQKLPVNRVLYFDAVFASHSVGVRDSPEKHPVVTTDMPPKTSGTTNSVAGMEMIWTHAAGRVLSINSPATVKKYCHSTAFRKSFSNREKSSNLPANISANSLTPPVPETVKSCSSTKNTRTKTPLMRSVKTA
jgi:hypothetical protein